LSFELGRADEALARVREGLQIVRGLREDGIDVLTANDVEHGVGERGVAAAWHDVEPVAEVAPDRVRRHVGAHDAHAALAVLAQRA
jgi:hypothetical protein